MKHEVVVLSIGTSSTAKLSRENFIKTYEDQGYGVYNAYNVDNPLYDAPVEVYKLSKEIPPEYEYRSFVLNQEGSSMVRAAAHDLANLLNTGYEIYDKTFVPGGPSASRDWNIVYLLKRLKS